MKSEVKLIADTGESVSEILTVQAGGRVSIVDALRALGIPEDEWKDTFLQAHFMLLPKRE